MTNITWYLWRAYLRHKVLLDRHQQTTQIEEKYQILYCKVETRKLGLGLANDQPGQVDVNYSDIVLFSV